MLLFPDEHISYKVVDRHIVLTKNSGVVKDVKIEPLPKRPEETQRLVSGMVSDSNNRPLPGANVVEKGTTNGVTTDFDGNYSIEISSPDAILTFSYVGFEKKDIQVGDSNTIDVSLQESAEGLDEVVVVGYGVQRKSDIVGSVASVSKERLEKSSDPNIFQTLQASVAGLNISRFSGDPGTNGSIQVRGINSISASNDPLIVLDGIPFSGNVRDINPNDIASIEVLKDASASAIYGSRAGSGVILITTKRGQSGTTIELNTSWSILNEATEYEQYDSQAFFEFRKEAFRSEGEDFSGLSDDEIAPLILEANELISFQRGESVNWLDQMLYRNALRQNHQISVSTGSDKISNYFSISYLDEEGLQKDTGFDRITLKNNLELKSIAPWLNIGNDFLFSYNDYERVAFGRNDNPAFYRLSPFARIFEDDGSYTEFPQANDDLLVNPIAENKLSSRENRFTNLYNNLYIEIKPKSLDGLSYRMNLGTSLRNTKSAIYWPRGTFLGNANNGLGQIENSVTWDITWENIVMYKKSFGKNNLDLTALYSQQTFDFERSGAQGSGFITDDSLWYDLASAENVVLPENSFGERAKSEWQLESLMFRTNYNYDNRYYLTGTVRRDGYSAFGPNDKYGVFPSLAVAWRPTEESFMRNIDWLSNLKLRASYGTVGNQAVEPYNSVARLGGASHIFGETVFNGVRASSLENANLTWEKATTLNLGLDYSFFNNRLSGTFDYYRTNTTDLLFNREIPNISGQSSVFFNVGELQNTGVELVVNAIPVQVGDFSWAAGFNFSSYRNQIIELFGDDQDDIENNLFIGEPLNVIYDYEFDGIWQLGEEEQIAASNTPGREPGDVRLVDQITLDTDGDGIADSRDGELTDEDRIIVGKTIPDWIGGLNTTLTYKDLSLYVYIQTVQGLERRFNEEGDYGRFNKSTYDYWTPENPSNTWYRPGISSTPGPTGSINVFDASFTRIKDVTLSYNIPNSFLNNLGLNKTRVFLNLHDYFTFTDFPFVDPETGNYGRISVPKYILLGFNITF